MLGCYISLEKSYMIHGFILFKNIIYCIENGYWKLVNLLRKSQLLTDFRGWRYGGVLRFYN